MQELHDRLLEIQEETQKSLLHLDLPQKKARLQVFEDEMSAPGFWDNTDSAQKTSREAGLLRNTIESWEKIAKDAQDLAELSEMIDPASDPQSAQQLENDLAILETTLRQLRTQLYLSGPFDSKDAIVSVHAGTGGVDAQDFAEMLLRMYLRFCEKRGWKASRPDISSAEEAGIKSASFKVEGDFAYGYLKHENGVHRLVRMSPFNSKGTRETSFALVEVTPEIEETEVEIKEEDLHWDVFRSGGSGGQSVNTTDSAVRVTHKPTGIVMICQNERSQLQNRQSALKQLKSKLVALAEKHHLSAIRDIRGEHVQHSWGNQIRSYVIHPYQMVKDHRTNHETSQVDAVLDGDLDAFIEASLRNRAT